MAEPALSVQAVDGHLGRRRSSAIWKSAWSSTFTWSVVVSEEALPEPKSRRNTQRSCPVRPPGVPRLVRRAPNFCERCNCATRTGRFPPRGGRGVTKRVTKPRRCRVCKQLLQRGRTGRPPLYCCAAHRQQAYRDAKAKRPHPKRSETDAWRTPPDHFRRWDGELGPFKLDPCATAENALCDRFFTAEDNGLTRDWGTERVFCNPPYSNPGPWAEKAYEASLAGATVVMLVKVSTDTEWWRTCVKDKATVRYLEGRLRFLDRNGEQRGPAPFASALLIYWPPQGDGATS